MKLVLPVLLLIVLASTASAQDLANIRDTKPVEFSGALSLRMNGYHTTRANSVRDPFFWTVTGSPTVSLYGVTMPFYFSFSEKNQDFRQPFNQFGVSPYYKWLRLHLGYRNLSFSDFTLSNHTFMGVGVEADHSLFRFGFVYGRFLKAINQPLDTLSGEIITPTFARKGVAARVGMGNDNNYVDLIFFKGKDDINSVDVPLDATSVTPGENLVYGIKARQQFLKRFTFDLDYGFSIYTTDITSAEVSTDDYNVPFFVSAFLTPRASTTFLMAGKAGLSMRLKMLSLRLQYTRVEPEYQSMGSYFLNNDYENITIAPSWTMLKNRIRISGSVGLQRNNILEDKISSTHRNINSINVAYTPNQKLQANVFYTNYRINQERNVRLTLDTLKLEQFSDNLNVTTSYNLGTKQIRHIVTAGINYQELRDDNNMSEHNTTTTSLNPSVGYRFQHVVAKAGAYVNVNLNQFTTDLNETVRWGYTLGGNKSLLDEKLRLNGSATLFTIQADGVSQSRALSFNGRVAYAVQDRHTFDLSVNFVSRENLVGDGETIRDVLGNVGYAYNFGRRQ